MSGRTHTPVDVVSNAHRSGNFLRVGRWLCWLQLWFLIFAWSSSAKAQASSKGATVTGRLLAHYQHTRWSATDGLPTSGVRTIRRSADGYLWLGSTNALVRFDGVRFVIIDSTREPALRSLVSGAVEPLLLDDRGVLWISRPDGALLHYRNGTFRVALAPDSIRGRVSSMTRDGLGRLWAMAARAFVIDTGGNARELALPPGVTYSDVQGLAADTGTGMWMGTRRGELWHLEAGGRFTREPIVYAGFGGVRPVLQSRDGVLWILNRGVEYRRDGRWWNVRSPQSSTGNVNGVRAAELPDGSVLVASRGYGLLRVHHGAVDEFIERDGLSDAVTRGVFVDVDGTVWISTDGGLDRLRRTMFRRIGPRDGLTLESPTLLHADGAGSIWLKDFGYPSLFRLDVGTALGETPIRITEVKAPQGRRYVPVGTRRGDGVWAFAGNSQLVTVRSTGVRPLRAQNWTDREPRLVLEARDGTLWIGFNNDGGGFGRVQNGRYAPLGAPELQPLSWGVFAVEDSVGGMWLQSERPAVLYHVVAGVIQSRHLSNVKGGFLYMTVEGGDTLWASQGADLVRFVGDRKTSVTIPSAVPLLRGESVALHATRGWLWLASSSGIGRLSMPALHRLADGRGAPPSVELMGVSDGLPASGLSVSIAQKATALDGNGRLWLATPAGLAVADLREAPPARVAPRTIIESVDVDGRSLVPDKPLILPSRPDRVVFRFTATAPSMPERVRLQFRLDGVDTSWQDVSGPRATTYTQLRHGRYTFRVRSWLDNWTEPVESQIALRVPAAWFESLWFALLLALLLVGAGVGVTRVVLRARARRASERLQARFEAEIGERNRLARELHDTLLQGFTGITLQLQAVQSQLPSSATDASASLERILQLADQSLRDARTMVWDMRAPSLDKFDLMSALESDGRAALGDSGIDFIVHCTGTPRRLADYVETALLRIGCEALANVRRHARASRITLRIDYSEAQVRLAVDDDGQGIASASFEPSPNGGWGVRGMRERAQQIGAHFAIGPSPEGGTRVEVVVPLDAAARSASASEPSSVL